MSRVRLSNRRVTERYQRRWQRHSLFIDIGRYPDGQPAEVFVAAARQGSEVLDLFGAFGIVASLALQNGVPAESIAMALKGYEAGSFPELLARCLLEPADPSLFPAAASQDQEPQPS